MSTATMVHALGSRRMPRQVLPLPATCAGAATPHALLPLACTFEAHPAPPLAPTCQQAPKGPGPPAHGVVPPIAHRPVGVVGAPPAAAATAAACEDMQQCVS